MNIVRSSISLLLVAIVILSGLGIFWWNQPPEPLQGYTAGGQVILGILIVSALVGLKIIWTPTDRAHQR